MAYETILTETRAQVDLITLPGSRRHQVEALS